MKINNMTAKTSLEIEDTDILVIQDGENTKQVTVAEFKDYLSLSLAKTNKKLINEAIDNVITALENAKFVLSELKTIIVGAWIGSTSGNIQIVLKDNETDKWLTKDEIDSFITDDFSIKVLIADMYQTPQTITVMDFKTEHPQGTNPVLEADEAGFIKVHIDGLVQNEIAGITYNDIVVSKTDTEDYRYEFTNDKETFNNAVPYIDNI